MVELVDSVDLGSTAKSVQVRVLLPAPRQGGDFLAKIAACLVLFSLPFSLFSFLSPHRPPAMRWLPLCRSGELSAPWAD